MNKYGFFAYLLVMALVTYLVRMIPLVLVKKRIKNKFLLSFLHYIPYAVLSAMTIPAIFYSTASNISAWIGFIVAVILAYFEKSLLKVAVSACSVVLLCEIIIQYCKF